MTERDRARVDALVELKALRHLQEFSGLACSTCWRGRPLLPVPTLDIGLPGMDGYEVNRKIRAMPALAATLREWLASHSRLAIAH